MNIIIPMAGKGKRLRPHTLTIPKPLLPVAGKPIVQRLVEDIAEVVGQKIENIGFVTGRFGEQVEQQLMQIAASVGARGSIHYQDEALGTAHAILCAGPLLNGNVMVAYADTLFKAGFQMDVKKEGSIWVSRVDNPEQFGVVKLDEKGAIEGFHEKPKSFVSDLAIIGIYYFRDGNILREELQFLLDQKITTGGEYGITDGLQNLMNKGVAFHTETVEEWLDCGNKDAIVDTNRQVLENGKESAFRIAEDVILDDALVIQPCYIAKGVKISKSIVGPYVSIGSNSLIRQSVIRNSIIQDEAIVENKLLENSMIGNFAMVKGQFETYSLGDFNKLD